MFSAGAATVPCGRSAAAIGLRLDPSSMLGRVRKEEDGTPLDGASWYAAESVDSGFDCLFPLGALAKAGYIAADMLLDGNTLVVFMLSLKENDQGRRSNFRFGGLNQCSFRVRMPLSLVDQNRWGIEREGAFLNPRCSGERVDLDKVDRMRLTIYRKGPSAERWCMTSFTVSEAGAVVVESHTPFIDRSRPADLDVIRALRQHNRRNKIPVARRITG